MKLDNILGLRNSKSNYFVEDHYGIIYYRIMYNEVPVSSTTWYENDKKKQYYRNISLGSFHVISGSGSAVFVGDL